MADEQRVEKQLQPSPPKWQFSLGTLLGFVVFVAAFCSLLKTPLPILFYELVVSTFLIPALLVTVIVYSKGYARTFCIGALFPIAPFFMAMSSYGAYGVLAMGYGDGSGYKGYAYIYFGTFLASAFSGLLCVGARWVIEYGRGWRLLVFWLAMLLLLLTGPIIGGIGVLNEWWPSDDLVEQLIGTEHTDPYPARAPVYPSPLAPSPPLATPSPTAPPPTWDPYASGEINGPLESGR